MSTRTDSAERMTCPCCGLTQRKAVDRATGVSAQVCDSCTNHQGDKDATRLRRAELHEKLLRERLERCRASEAKASKDAEEARRAMVAALQGRGQLARRIIDEADRGHAGGVARDPEVIKWARRADQDDQRHDSPGWQHRRAPR